MHRLIWLTGLVVVLLAVAGCAAQSGAPKPPEIHLGEDVCADCGMIINDPRFASAYAYEEAPGRTKSLVFDDIGDMLAHMAKNPTLKAVGWWVHDYDSEQWIDATTATYVMSSQIKTPMNHGLAAFATEAGAQKLAGQTKGQVMNWATLLKSGM